MRRICDCAGGEVWGQTVSAEIDKFYSIDGSGRITEWSVESRTPKTYSVVEHNGYKRTVKSADIGRTWFATKRDALESKRIELEREVEWAKQRLQGRRTALGMIESEIKRCNDIP